MSAANAGSTANAGDEATKNIFRNPRRWVDCGVVGSFDDEDTMLRELRQKEDREWLNRQRTDLQCRLIKEAEKMKSKELLHLLPETDLMAMQKYFPRGTQLDCPQFVALMLREFRRHPGVCELPEATLVGMLTDLFETMDLNANHVLTWETFSSFFINAYSALQAHKRCIMPYVHDAPWGFHRHFRHGHLIHLPALDNYVALGTISVPLRHILMLYDARGNGVEFENETNTEFLAAEYLPTMRQLVASTAQSQLLFYEMRRDIPAKHMYKLRGRWWSELSIGLLRWCEEMNMLLGADMKEGWLGAYRLQNDMELMGGTPTLKQKLHQAAITDLLPIPDQNILVTSSLDREVKIHDMFELREICPLGPSNKGHTKGVLSLSFSSRLNMLVTAGYEYEPILWMPIPGLNQFIARLCDMQSPHRNTIKKVAFVADTPELISMDSIGMIKVWDVRMYRVVQSFHMDHNAPSDEYNLHCLMSGVYDPKNRRVTALGRNHRNTMVYHWNATAEPESNPTKAHDSAPIACHYHPSTNLFLTCDPVTIKIWHGTRGHVLTSFSDVGPLPEAVITCIKVDHCSRRFLMGTFNGTVSLHSLGSGQLTSRFRGHDREVRLLQFCEQKRFPCIVSACRSGVMHVYPNVGVAKHTVPPHLVIQLRGIPSHCAFSPRGHCLVVANNKDCVTVFQFHGDTLMQKAECRYPSSGKGLRLSRDMINSRDSSGSRGQVSHAISNPDDALAQGYVPQSLQEISAMAFMAPHAAFLCADTNGLVTMWSLPPSLCPFEPKTQFPLSMPQNGVSSAVATYLEYIEASCLLLCGDDRGYVSMWRMSEVLHLAKLEMLEDIYMRATSTAVDGRPLWKVKPKSWGPTLVFSWSAHDSITHMQYVPTKQFIVTGSDDGMVTIWSFRGNVLGHLQQGRGNKECDQSLLTPFCMDNIDEGLPSPKHGGKSAAMTFGTALDRVMNFFDGDLQLGHSMDSQDSRPQSRVIRSPLSPGGGALSPPKLMFARQISFCEQLDTIEITEQKEPFKGISHQPPKLSVNTALVSESPVTTAPSTQTAPEWKTSVRKKYRKMADKATKAETMAPRAVNLTRLMSEGKQWCTADVTEEDVSGILNVIISPRTPKSFNPHLQSCIVLSQEDRDFRCLTPEALANAHRAQAIAEAKRKEEKAKLLQLLHFQSKRLPPALRPHLVDAVRQANTHHESKEAPPSQSPPSPRPKSPVARPQCLPTPAPRLPPLADR